MALFRAPDRGDPSVRVAFLVALLGAVLVGLYILKPAATNKYAYIDPSEQEMETADGDPFQELDGNVEDMYHTVFSDTEFIEQYPEKGYGLDLLEESLIHIFDWLAGRSNQELAAQARSRSTWHISKLLRDPNRWRGKVLHVHGMLADKEVVELPSAPAGMRKLFLLRLYDTSDEEFFSILTPEMPANVQVFQEKDEEEGFPQILGDELSLDGVFLMLWPYRKRSGHIKSTPLFVARRVYKAREGQTPPILFDERSDPNSAYEDIEPEKSVPGLDTDFIREKIFAPPTDGGRWRTVGTDFRALASDLRAEKAVFDHAFEFLLGRDPAWIRQQAQNPEVHYQSLMQGTKPPDWMVGKLTEVRGIAAAVEPMRFPPGQFGVKRIYLVTVWDTRFKHPQEHSWTVATYNLPEGLREGDSIEADGLFIKVYPYRTRFGAWAWAPLVVTRELKKVDPPISPLAPSWMSNTQVYILCGVIVAFCFAALIWLYRASQKDTEKLKNIRQRSQDTRVNALRRRAERKQQREQQDDPLSMALGAPLSGMPPPSQTPNTQAVSADGEQPEQAGEQARGSNEQTSVDSGQASEAASATDPGMSTPSNLPHALQLPNPPQWPSSGVENIDEDKIEESPKKDADDDSNDDPEQTERV